MALDSQLSVTLNLVFDPEEANDEDEAAFQVDLYDGAKTIFGLGRALQIAAHFLVNQEVIFQAPSARGVRLYLVPARRGSFDQLIQLVIEHKEIILVTAATTLTTEVVRDFLGYVIRKSCGLVAHASTYVVREISKQMQADLEALEEAMLGPLVDAHRAIEKGSARTRLKLGGDQIEFDDRTYANVRDRILSPHKKTLAASVSSYNINSFKGRLYNPELGRTIPFKMRKRSLPEDLTPLSWSLDERNKKLDGLIDVDVLEELSPQRTVRSYILLDCRFR